MRHLKKFNESTSKDIIQNIKDILMDLYDDGFDIRISGDNTGYLILIKLEKKDGFYADLKDWFHLIKDYILSVIDYMKSENHTTYFFKSKTSTHDIDEYEHNINKNNGIIFILKFGYL